MKHMKYIILALVLLLCSCGQSGTIVEEDDTTAWQEQYDLGVRYLSEGNYEEAVIAFTAAIEIDPKQAPAYVGRGDAYIGSGETEDNLAAAQADYEKALELDEINVNAYLGLADVYIRQGDYDKAEKILRNGLEKTGTDQAIVDKLAEIKSGQISDSSGHARRTSAYADDGSLLWYHLFDYDELGREKSVTAFSREGVQVGHIDLVYDKDGNQLVNYTPNLDTGELFKTVEQRNEKGQIIKRSRYDVDGTVESSEMFSYDGNGNPARVDEYDENSNLIGYITYTSENGNIVETRFHDRDGVLYEREQYVYDKQGNRTRTDEFDGSGSLRTYTIYTYDVQGNCSRADFYLGDGTSSGYELLHYDENGELLEWELADADGTVVYSETGK